MSYATIETVEALEALYGSPKPAATVKVADRLTPEYRAWIDAAPFCALGTIGPEGLDVSPRGDAGTVVHAIDDKTLAMPDRRGNDRLDSLRNVVRDPRVSLMLMVPGENTVIRIVGEGAISAQADLLQRFEMEGALPRSVLLVSIQEIYFQCARAPIRAKLWAPSERRDLPTPGQILAAMSAGAEGGESYDRDWPARAAKTMW
ncbi:MAG: pyridoxamine 5'-phosphate oxidase family protein [Pseudomonadota bacterium]